MGAKGSVVTNEKSRLTELLDGEKGTQDPEDRHAGEQGVEEDETGRLSTGTQPTRPFTGSDGRDGGRVHRGGAGRGSGHVRPEEIPRGGQVEE